MPVKSKAHGTFLLSTKIIFQGVDQKIKSYQINLFKLGNVKRRCPVSRAEGSFHIFLPHIETKRCFHRYRILILRRSPNAHYFCIKAKTSFLFYATASLVETFFIASSFPCFTKQLRKSEKKCFLCLVDRQFVQFLLFCYLFFLPQQLELPQSFNPVVR